MVHSLVQSLSAALNARSRGIVTLRAEYDIPSNLRALKIAFPDYLSPVETTGFAATGNSRCEWDGETRRPWIRFRYRVDRTDAGGYEFVDTGGWAILRYPPINLSWQYTGADVAVSYEYGVRGEGVTSSDGSLVYLGPHREQRFRGGGQQFRLAVPDAASPAGSLADVRETLCHAAAHLDVGGRDDEVVAVAAPSDVNWGAGGLQSGANGFWALDSSRIDRATNTWVHEYIHTRQEWERDESTDWLVEGTTEYYAALLTFRQGRISFDAFHRHVATDQHAESVLVDPGRWTSPNAHYTKGRRVTAALDATIRRATDGDRTFQDAFRLINRLDGRFTHDDLRNVLDCVVGRDFEEWLSKYIEGARVPPVPDDEACFVGDATPTETGETGGEDGGGGDDKGGDGSGDGTPTAACPVCGAAVEIDERFCGACGTDLFKQCPVCGRDATGDYCSECGTSLIDACEVCGARRHPSEEYCSRCGTAF